MRHFTQNDLELAELKISKGVGDRAELMRRIVEEKERIFNVMADEEIRDIGNELSSVGDDRTRYKEALEYIKEKALRLKDDLEDILEKIEEVTE